jgi:hypothetical protein
MLALSLSMTACPAATSPSSNNAQAVAQQSVVLLGDAWTAAANACVAAGEATRVACQPALDQAKPAILAAASAVDGWSAANQSNWACLAQSAVQFLNQLSVYAPKLVIPPIVLDAIGLINQYAAQSCVAPVVDGGNG